MSGQPEIRFADVAEGIRSAGDEGAIAQAGDEHGNGSDDGNCSGVALDATPDAIDLVCAALRSSGGERQRRKSECEWPKYAV